MASLGVSHNAGPNIDPKQQSSTNRDTHKKDPQFIETSICLRGSKYPCIRYLGPKLPICSYLYIYIYVSIYLYIYIYTNEAP